MSVANPLILFNNHFSGHRRQYPYRTRLAIAADLGYDGYEFHAIESDDDQSWKEGADALLRSGMRHSGMYVVVRGVNDDEVDGLDAEIDRMQRIIRRMAGLTPKPYLLLAIGSNLGGLSLPFHESGSVCAEARHWKRAQTIVEAADSLLIEHGMNGYLYNHVWFMIDTPQAALRLLTAAKSRAIRPGLACFHSHFHKGVPDPHEMLTLPGMEGLGYVALLNAVPKPEPFRTVPIDQGNIDIAGLLAILWEQGYEGPLVAQAYDLGGDPYMSAKRSIDYVREVRDRLDRNPAVNPARGRVTY